MDIKYLFAIITVIAVALIQMVAFALGIDGNVFSGTTAIITALIFYILGVEIKNVQIAKILNLIKEKIEATSENKEDQKQQDIQLNTTDQSDR